MPHSTGSITLVDFLVRLAGDWRRCKERFERTQDRIKPLEQQRQRIECAKGVLETAQRKCDQAITPEDKAAAAAELKAAESALAALGNESDCAQLQTTLDAVESRHEREGDALYDHPFPGVARRIVRLTGWQGRNRKQSKTPQLDAIKDVMHAATIEFAGYGELVAKMHRLDADDKVEPLYLDFLKQHSELAAKIGLTAVALKVEEPGRALAALGSNAAMANVSAVAKNTTRRFSKAQLAQSAVFAWFQAHPESDPTADEIAKSVGIDAATVRNAPAWKLHKQGKERAAKPVGDGADLGDIDASLEALIGRQERGRDRSKLRRR